jgi:ankyrin repeat protein
MCAVSKGYATVVKLMLQQGNVDLEAKDKRGRTLLVIAGGMKDETVLSLLLQKGANSDCDTSEWPVFIKAWLSDTRFLGSCSSRESKGFCGGNRL